MLLLSKNDALLSRWSGGTTAQLMIFPESAEYKERDFDYRISVATIDDEHSTFTLLPDYHRYLIALSDKICLIHNKDEIQLNRCELYEFEGCDNVESHGKAMDFGIMCRKGRCHANIEIFAYEMNEIIPDISDFAYCALGLVEDVDGELTVKSGKAVVIFVKIEYDFKLVLPSSEHKELWEAAIAELKEFDEPTAMMDLGKDNYEDFLQQTINERNLTERQYDSERGFVMAPSTTMFLMDECENKILGRISCRRLLTQALRERGGNVGYIIVPSMRKRGYATKMLNIFLKECIDMGLAAVIIACDASNVGSKKTILNNGGILYGKGHTDDGTEYERYYILTL